MKFALKWPVRGILNQPCADRILSHIPPLLLIRFLRPHYVIEETLLPIGSRNFPLPEILHQRTLESFGPSGQGRRLRTKGSKQVHVVGHDDVAAHQDSSARSPLGNANERLMRRLVGQGCLPLIRTRGEEVDRRSREQPFKSLQPRPKHNL